LSGIVRGDLVFWPGHVAIVADHETIVHANALQMAVVKESLFDAVERIAAIEGPIRTVRRP
jgi:cell wall-associated NlpC family hydrolase